MAFDPLETSTEQGSPIELYEFALGSTIYRFTTNPTDVSYLTPGRGVVVYTAVAVGRDSINIDADKRTDVLRLGLPSNQDFVRAYINNVPGAEAQLTIWRVQRIDPDSPPDLIQVFTGAVHAVSFSLQGMVAEIVVMPLSGNLAKTIPRFVFSSVCNHVLYGADCTVNKNSFKFTAAVTVVSGDSVTLPGLSANGNGWATAGFMARANGDYRLIMYHTGNVVRLLFPFPDDILAETVDVYAGCDHSIEACGAKFTNTINHGGFVFIPVRNPFQSGVA